MRLGYYRTCESFLYKTQKNVKAFENFSFKVINEVSVEISIIQICDLQFTYEYNSYDKR
jgi:hypothetical protein